MASILAVTMRYLDTLPGYACPKYCQVDHAHFPRPTGVGTEHLQEEYINASEIKEAQRLEFNESIGEVPGDSICINGDICHRNDHSDH